ncbi:MAG: deoxyribodipyrimidine photo-lyase [Bacteroidota bacterium]
MSKLNCFWFRRDLRMTDNTGLYHALRAGLPVLPVFIFDTHILDKLEDRDDARVTFLHQTLHRLQSELADLGSTLYVANGKPEAIWPQILDHYDVDTVYTNRDYEPYAKTRDAAIEELLTARGVGFSTFKDHVIQEGGEVLKKDGTPYTVFTPYSRTWRANLKPEDLEHIPCEDHHDRFVQHELRPIPTLEEMGFSPSSVPFPAAEVNRGLIRNYDQTRNFPGVRGTSRLGLHFRFGTISIREKARKAMELNQTFVNELIWRDFYAMILYHFPHVVGAPFREKYQWIEWRNDAEEFAAWCAGQTGYPIVDAGMRELNATGYMHNRVRMIVASFLTKHLLIDWQWGEAYFARKLLDFDLASNNGGWQWAAGCGTDAAPYFRVFNPTTQMQKFDKDLVYVKKWVPEFGGFNYRKPIVDHKMARERCLATYKAGLSRAEVEMG